VTTFSTGLTIPPVTWVLIEEAAVSGEKSRRRYGRPSPYSE
jgi:hypothetical protein